MANSSIRWLSAKIMSNEIPVSGLKQRDGHVPSTRTLLGAILSSPRSTGINEKSALEWRQSGDARSVASSPENGGLLFLRTRCGQSGWYSPPEWAKKRTEERTSSRAFQSVYEIHGEGRDPIRRGIRSRQPGTRLTLDRDLRPRALLECEMSRRTTGN